MDRQSKKNTALYTLPHYQITFHSIQNGGELNKTLDTFRMLQVNFQKICRRFEEGGQK